MSVTRGEGGNVTGWVYVRAAGPVTPCPVAVCPVAVCSVKVVRQSKLFDGLGNRREDLERLLAELAEFDLEVAHV